MPIKFPQLSRKPALKTRGAQLDTTLRDNYENGMESTRARSTRRRRQWDVSIDLLTPEDMLALDKFVENRQQGALSFLFQEYRDPAGNVFYNVRFLKIPEYTDAGNVEGEWRQNCTFTIREV